MSENWDRYGATRPRAAACLVAVAGITFRAMSHLSPAELAALKQVAFDMSETFGERGHRIDAAMEVDEAFATGGARSALVRGLAINSAAQSASNHGQLDFRTVNRSGKEFRYCDDGVDRRFRLRKGRRDEQGTLVVTAGQGSVFATEEPSLFREEHWVIAYTVNDDNLIDEVVAAQVLDYIDGHPGRLLLGPEIPLLTGDHTRSGRGFRPSTDDDLPGFEDDARERRAQVSDAR